MEHPLNFIEAVITFLVHIANSLDYFVVQLVTRFEPAASVLSIPSEALVFACFILGLLIISSLLNWLFRLLYPPVVDETITSSGESFFFEMQMEELAMDAEALEELYDKGYISAELFHEEALAFKHQSELLLTYLLSK